MDSGSPTSSKEKLQSWLRYYEDLGIRAFYRDRAPQQASMEAGPSMTKQKGREAGGLAAVAGGPDAPAHTVLPSCS